MLKKVVKWIVFAIILFIIIGFIIIRKNKNTRTKCYPQIRLLGNEFVTLGKGEKYTDSGYDVIDSCGENLKNRVTIKNNINYNKVGTYEITYIVDNQYGNVAKARRFVKITEKKNYSYQESYNKIDNQVRGWGVPKQKDGTRPVEAGAVRDELLKYNAYLIGNNDKTLYLTFDEGSNDTYVKEIVDVLNKNNVKATFFFCKQYIMSNPDLMREIAKTGHSVGNHTANHQQMPKYATAEGFQTYLKEITTVEKAYQSITGTNMDRIYREPKGEYSFRSLQIMKDMGYRTYFWSAAYLDYLDDVSKEEALNELVSRVHNGAIYLIHPKNKGNAEALGDFIQQMKEKGYTFDLVKNIK